MKMFISLELKLFNHDTFNMLTSKWLEGIICLSDSFKPNQPILDNVLSYIKTSESNTESKIQPASHRLF